MNAQWLTQLLKPWVSVSEHKIFLILGNLRVHHAKSVKARLADERNKVRIEVFFLLAYSLKLNLDEYLNCDLKADVPSKPPSRDASPLEKKVRSHMKTLQKSLDRVQKYFRRIYVN